MDVEALCSSPFVALVVETEKVAMSSRETEAFAGY